MATINPDDKNQPLFKISEYPQLQDLVNSCRKKLNGDFNLLFALEQALRKVEQSQTTDPKALKVEIVCLLLEMYSDKHQLKAGINLLANGEGNEAD